MKAVDLNLTEIAERALLFDNAITLDGNQSDGVGMLAPTTLGKDHDAFTIEMWVNPSAGGGNMALFSDNDVVGGVYRYVQKAWVDSQGRIGYYQYRWDRNYNPHETTRYRYSATNAITFNDWNHVAFTMNNGRMRVYINGEPVVMGNADGTDQVHENQLLNMPFSFANSGGEQIFYSGQELDNRWGTILNNFDGSIGMLRLWETARTADQIITDHEDLYTASLPGLLAQWTFDNEVLSLPDDIHGELLTIRSTDGTTYPIRWSTAFAFVEVFVNKSVAIWLDEPQPLGNSSRNYTLNLYERGTGKLFYSIGATASFTHPGVPGVQINENMSGPYSLDVTITPASKHVDSYIIERAEGTFTSLDQISNSEFLTEVKLDIQTDDQGNRILPEPLVFADQYAYNGI